MREKKRACKQSPDPFKKNLEGQRVEKQSLKGFMTEKQGRGLPEELSRTDRAIEDLLRSTAADAKTVI